MQEHTDDLRNVDKDDTVEITTTEGKTFEAECTATKTERAAPGSGEVRESHLWEFETPHGNAVASILDGLKSSPNDPDLPQYHELWHMEEGDGMGYIQDVIIYGDL